LTGLHRKGCVPAKKQSHRNNLLLLLHSFPLCMFSLRDVQIRNGMHALHYPSANKDFILANLPETNLYELHE
jgi:hypothetical protein